MRRAESRKPRGFRGSRVGRLRCNTKNKIRGDTRHACRERVLHGLKTAIDIMQSSQKFEARLFEALHTNADAIDAIFYEFASTRHIETRWVALGRNLDALAAQRKRVEDR